MLKIEGEKLRALQLIQLEMLKEVDRICRKCGIHYVIIAGTLLGAIRHGGFIPWDDDADIAMMRSEYERFREACKKELDTSRFYFQDHQETAGYRWGYGKLRRKDSLFLREHQEHMPYEQGIFIDIFPMDYVPDQYALRALWNFECFCVRKVLWSRVGKVAETNKFKRCIYQLLDQIPERLVLSYYEGLIRRSGKHKTGWVRILMFPTPNRAYGYRTRWYIKSKQISFEGKLFYGIADAEGYLRFKFGNYMELPPEKERKIHPVSAIRIPKETEKEVLDGTDNGFS